MTSNSAEQRIIDEVHALLPRLDSLKRRAREISPPPPTSTPRRVQRYREVQDALQGLANHFQGRAFASDEGETFVAEGDGEPPGKQPLVRNIRHFLSWHFHFN
jgi:hypothetical protein